VYNPNHVAQLKAAGLTIFRVKISGARLERPLAQETDGEARHRRRGDYRCG
jgi:hypothetical protein